MNCTIIKKKLCFDHTYVINAIYTYLQNYSFPNLLKYFEICLYAKNLFHVDSFLDLD